MAEHVLVSPLGRSPGAVSGVVRALKVQEDVEIERVITVGTLDGEVVKAQEYLCDLLEDPPFGTKYTPIEITDPTFTSINPESAEIYFGYMRQALEEAAEGSNTVHLVTTAGSSGMGALAVLASNFHGADCLWHYWVPDLVARSGTFGNTQCELRPAPFIDSTHPSLNPFPAGRQREAAHQFHLHPIPRFINLKPLAPMLQAFEASQGAERPDLDSIWYHLSTLSGVEDTLQLFMDIPLNAVHELVALAPSEWGELTDLEQEQVKNRVSTVLLDYNITAPGLRERIFAYIETGGGEEVFRAQVADVAAQEGRGGRFAKQLAYDLSVNLIASIIDEVGKRSMGIA